MHNTENKKTKIVYFLFRDVKPGITFRYGKRFFIKHNNTFGLIRCKNNGWSSIKMVDMFLTNDFVAVQKD